MEPLTIEQINALDLNDVFSTIAYRVITTPSTMGTDAQLSPYDNLVMTDTEDMEGNIITHEKPTFESFEAEFLVYQQELIDAETERLRREDLTNRYHALEYKQESLRSLGHVSNPARWILDLLENPDHDWVEEYMVNIETAHPNIKVDIDFKKLIQEEIEIGSKIDTICTKILKVVKGHNYKAALTTEEILAFKATFATINEYLKDGQPLGAKLLIEAITGYDALKAKVLKIYEMEGM